MQTRFNMYWKYHIEAEDAVEFTHNGNRGWGTVLGWIDPEQYEDKSFDELEPGDFELRVQSQNEEYTVNLDDIHNRVPADEREGDLHRLGERMRLSGGLKQ